MTYVFIYDSSRDTAFSRILHDEIITLDPPSSSLSDDTIRLLDKYTTHLSLFESTPSVSNRRQLDIEGVSLWNACAQSGQSSSNISLLINICKGNIGPLPGP